MGRFALLWVALAAIMVFGWSEPGGKAQAMGLCNCCDGTLTQSCNKICSKISLAPGMCPAIVDYEGTGGTPKGANPLNGMSFKDLAIGEPTRGRLERFRRFVESGRRQGISSYKSALRHLKRRKISETAFDKAKSLYQEAIINYYHGIRAYLNRVGTKSD